VERFPDRSGRSGRRATRLGFLKPEAVDRLGLGPEDDLHRDQHSKGTGHDQQREGRKNHGRLGNAADRKAW